MANGKLSPVSKQWILLQKNKNAKFVLVMSYVTFVYFGELLKEKKKLLYMTKNDTLQHC